MGIFRNLCNNTFTKCNCQTKYQEWSLRRRFLNDCQFPSRTRSFSMNHTNASSVHTLLASSNVILPNATSSWVNMQHFSSTLSLYDKEPSSKVKATVETLKKDQRSKEHMNVKEKTLVKIKKPIKQLIIDECLHYYHGFKLLFMNIKVSSQLLRRILNGHTLTRREHMLLIRTVGDVFRLVPFSVFILIPFSEIALPFVIKFFPGFLPSTFEKTSEREHKMKQSLKVKLEMAKFLRETLDEIAVEHKDRNSKSAKEFVEWFHKIRSNGTTVSNDDIIKFAKLFKDEITLDSLTRSQLVALCRVLEIHTLGTNNLLRFQLRMKLMTLAADDKLIQKEGIDSLSFSELQNACKTRGMRAYGVSDGVMKTQLLQWLDLSMNKQVPPSLLLLSRAMMLPETIPTTDKLKATINVLPNTIVAPTKAAIGETEGKINNKVKLEVLHEEVRKLKEEQDEMEQENKRKEDTMDGKQPLKEAGPYIDNISPHLTNFKNIADLYYENKQKMDKTKKETTISPKDLNVLEHAIENMSQDNKKLKSEKESIKSLKQEMANYQENVKELKEVTSDTPKPEVEESVAAKRLCNKVNRMIENIDTKITQIETKDQKTMKAPEQTPAMKNDTVRIDDILDTIKFFKEAPNEEVLKQIQNILRKIDNDKDGSIKIKDVLKILKLIGKENIQLNSKQVDEVVDLLKKEEILKIESRPTKSTTTTHHNKETIEEEKKPQQNVAVMSQAKPGETNES